MDVASPGILMAEEPESQERMPMSSVAYASVTETIRSISRVDPVELDAEVSGTARVDLVKLTKALVFTKEDYRMARPSSSSRERPSRPEFNEENAPPALRKLLHAASATPLTAADLEAEETAASDPETQLMVDEHSDPLPIMRLATECEADALTPWDLIEEVDAAAEGVTFTMFQARRAARRQQAA